MKLGAAVTSLAFTMLAPFGSAYAQPAVEHQPVAYQQGQYPYGQGPGLEAGGLTPPGPMEEPGYGGSETERRLEEAERKDSGRGLQWVYVNGEAGVSHVGLQTFRARNLIDAGVVNTNGTGFTWGAGLGVRLVFLTLGARFRLADFADWDIWTLNGELGLRIPLGRIEPYLSVSAGYASLGAFGMENVGSGLRSENVDITGYNIRGGGGLDVFVTNVLSIGASVTGEMLGLTRPGVDPSRLQDAPGTGDPRQDAEATADRMYAADGSSLGFGVTATLVVGLHF